MPFCPNCKAEYQEGFTICADCKVELVDNIKEAEVLVPFFQADNKKVAEKLVKFFNYSDVSSSMEYDKDNDTYVVSVPPRKQLEAKKLYQAFYFVERERLAAGQSDLPLEDDEEENQDEATDAALLEEEISSEDKVEAEEDSDHSLEHEGPSADNEDYAGETPSDEVTAFDNEDEDDGSVYVMKADQYKDLNGTVGVFLFFGIAGLIVVLINLLGVINIFSGWIPNTVMTALFIFFIYVASSTNQKARKIKAEIAEEDALTEKINAWLKQTVTEEFLTYIHKEELTDEMNYIKKLDKIKELLITEFGHQNLAYLDRLIEEYYNNTFDN